MQNEKFGNMEICKQCGINVNEMRGNTNLLTDGATESERQQNKADYNRRCGKAVNRYEKQAEKYIKSALSDNFLSNI